MKEDESPYSNEKIIELIVTLFVLAVFIFLFTKVLFF